ncbi:amino acid permease [Paenibacillus pasadenensis]|uniref:Urea carboxylase-related amino acid permease n=2 Tax=Paenibacillus pasadenensis TaxID=217090 RepID=A0A2N5N6B9_9BACL|nr:amino acid permease [Paenibacillus pasadenensis]PLT45901.1 Urea carboxylase-related amino acid permease [Paenibacillus pasadenensis]
MWIWIGFGMYGAAALAWLAVFAAAERRRQLGGYQSLTKYAAYIQFMQDKSELNRYGYAQRLKRAFGPFAAFALPFNAMALLGGGALFLHVAGPGAAGGLILWAWPLLGLGALAVHAVSAELMSAVPTAKGTSHAAEWLAGKAAGRASGLLRLGGQWALAAWMSLEAARWLGQSWQGWLGGSAAAVAAVALAFALALQGLVCLAGNGCFGFVQRAVAAVQIGCCLLLLALLAGALWPNYSLPSILPPLGQGAGTGAVPLNADWALGALLLWRLFLSGGAAEAAAEETVEPRMRLPWGQFQSAAYLYTGGYVLLALAAMYAASRPLGGAAGAWLHPVSSAIASSPGAVLALDALVAVSLLGGSLSLLFASTRLAGALARDSSHPALARLARVAVKRRTYDGAAMLAVLAAAALAAGSALLPASGGAQTAFLLALGVMLHHGALLLPLSGLLRLRRGQEHPALAPLWSPGPARGLLRWTAAAVLAVVAAAAAAISPAALAAALVWLAAALLASRPLAAAGAADSRSLPSRQELLQLERSHPQ